MIQHNGAALTLLTHRIETTLTTARTLGGEPAAHADTLDTTWQRLLTVTTTLLTAGDPATTMANATTYLETFGHLVIAWIWLEQTLATHNRHDDFYEGKRAAARYFYRYELPRTRPQLDLLATLDHTTLDMRDNWF